MASYDSTALDCNINVGCCVNGDHRGLADKFRVMDDQPNQKAISSLDKLNDTIISLYECAKTFKSYGAFYKWPNVKFIARNKRPKKFRPVETPTTRTSRIHPDREVVTLIRMR